MDKTEALIRQFDEVSRTRTLNEVGDGVDELELLDEGQLDLSIPRSLEALDLADA